MDAIRKLLGRYRNEIKGVAILWVVFFHARLGLNGALYQIQRIGYGGVDIFFFMSGFGLFYSLEKDADLGGYLKRRAGRLLPSYLPFCLVWLAVMLPMFGLGLANSARVAMSNLTMLGFLTGTEHYINWYTGALLVSLLLAPFFHAVLKPGKHYWLRVAGLLAVLFAVGLGYIDDNRYMAISRLPVFALGMVAAGCQLSDKQRKIALPALMVCAAAALVVLYRCLDHYVELLVPYAMYWHPFVLITPVLCIVLGWLFSHLSGAVLKPLRCLGEASFEIFLFNVWYEVLGAKIGLMDSPLECLLWSIGSIALGCIYHTVIAAAMKKWKHTAQKI